MFHCVERVGVRLVLDVGEPLVQPGSLALAPELDLFDLAESGKNLLRKSFKLNFLGYLYTASPEDDLCSRSWSTSQCGSLLTGGGRHQIRSKVPLSYAHCESQQSYWQKVT